jgi:hypothetical protein
MPEGLPDCLPFADEGALRPGPLEAYYDAVRSGPPFRDEVTGLWVVSAYNDVRELLRNSHDFANSATLLPHYPLCPEAMELLMRLDAPGTTAGGDGDVHARARRAIAATLPITAAKVEAQVGERVRRCVQELIDAMPGAARPSQAVGDSVSSMLEVDLIASLAWELPLRVICEIIGIPAERYDDVKAWSEDQVALVWGQLEDAEQVRCAQGLLSLWGLCQQLIADREKQPPAASNGEADDMASRLVAYQRDTGGAITGQEAASILLNLAVAGHETTANALGNAIYYLLSHPNHWGDLVVGNTDLPALVEELLRLQPPIIGWSRITTGDVTVSGTDIPAHERVLLLLGAANRDPHAFPRPDELDPGQDYFTPQLAFGIGIHHCVGAPLARLQLTEALQGLAATHPELTLRPGLDDTTVAYKPNIAFRALSQLPVLGHFHRPHIDEDGQANHHPRGAAG